MIRRAAREDFDQILTEIEDFWGDDDVQHLHQPFLIRDFGDTAFVVPQPDTHKILAYLFAYYSQTEPIAWIHLAATRSEYRGRSLARSLYEHILNLALVHGCEKLRVIVNPENTGALAFHEKLGFQIVDERENYDGSGEDRILFEKGL